MDSRFFNAVKIVEDNSGAIWKIRGVAGENAYLLEGSRYALLIDTLTGAGNLKKFCRELTSLPVHVVLTHGHVDHAGGCYDFDACFIHPDDIRIMYKGAIVECRMDFIDRFTGGKASVVSGDFTPPGPMRTFPVYDGDVFDIGGRCLEVIAVPGHTEGTIVLLEKETGILFSGDACNTNTLLNLDGSTSIFDYRKSLLHLKERQGECKCLWGGHGDGGEPLSPAIIDEAIGLCDRILAGTDASEVGGSRDGVTYYYAKSRQEDTNFKANIAYRKDWIREAPVCRQEPLRGCAKKQPKVNPEKYDII